VTAIFEAIVIGVGVFAASYYLLYQYVTGELRDICDENDG
jgi:hypothetical protein